MNFYECCDLTKKYLYTTHLASAGTKIKTKIVKVGKKYC